MAIYTKQFFVILCVSFLVGCATTTKLSKKPVLSNNGEALVYLIRPDMHHGYLIGHKAYVNGQEIANLANGSFTYFYAQPGVYQLRAGDDKGLMQLPSAFAQVEVKAGHTYYFMLKFKMEEQYSSTVIPVGNLFIPVAGSTEVPKSCTWVQLANNHGSMVVGAMKCSLPKIETAFRSSTSSGMVPNAYGQAAPSGTVHMMGEGSASATQPSESVDMEAYYEKQLQRTDLSPGVRAYYEKKLNEE